MTEASAPRSKWLGPAFALIAFALFSTHDTVVKTLGGEYAVFQIIFFSVLFSFPLLMLMLMQDRTRGTLIPVHPWWSALRTAMALITGICAFYAFSTIPLAQVYAMIFASPMLITVLSIPVLGERVGVHRWAAVIVGLIGVIVVLRPGSAELTLGHIAALTAAFTSAVASVVVRKIGRDERSAVLLLYPMTANFLILGALLPFFYKPMPIEHLGGFALIAVLAFFGGLMLILAYKAADAAIIAPMQYSQILWAAVFGWALFNETADQLTWVGAGIIVASGLYIVVRESFGGRSETTPVLRTKPRPATGTSPRTRPLERLDDDGDT
jgi:S-adenosylmethionine uptake transporter